MTKETGDTATKQGSGVDATLARHGGLSYLEIPATDAHRSAEFYRTVVGWSIDDRGAGDLRFSDTTGHLIGRWVTDRQAARDPGLLPYIYVDDVAKAVELATSHGGEVIRAPYPEGNLWVATVRDPAGNVIGLWQAR